jgi:hypothetical protein
MRPARSGSCSSELLRVRAVEEPERTFGSTRSAAAACFHRIFERFHDEWEARVRRRSHPGRAADAAIAEEECDARRERGETGYPAMWAADRVEVIEDCVRWLEVERDDPLTRALPLVAVRGALRSADDRREAGLAVAD